MSSALLRKSLALCDPEVKEVKNGKKKRSCKAKDLKARVTKLNKVQIIQSNKKVTVNEAREQLKSREKILEENLRRIKQFKKACTVNLDKDITEQIIERAVSRKPIKPKEEKQPEPTAFTEEDFKKFEEEYLDY